MFYVVNLDEGEVSLLRTWLLGERRRLEEDIASFKAEAQASEVPYNRTRWSDVAKVTRRHLESLDRIVSELDAALLRARGGPS